MSSPRGGRVVSADIAVPEHERVVRFYSRVLTTGKEPLWRDDLMNNVGTPIIGLGARTSEHDALPLQWMPHIQVADVAASLSRALDLGGIQLMHGKDDDGTSRWAVLLDPDGAAFGIIPTTAEAPATGTEAAEPAGRIAYLTLAVSEASATRDFYQRAVGWQARDVSMEDAHGQRYHDYELMDDHGQPVAAIHYARGANQSLPPIWLIHLPVGDVTESVANVRREGGKVLRTTRGDAEECVHAVVQDPVGALFALVPG